MAALRAFVAAAVVIAVLGGWAATVLAAGPTRVLLSLPGLELQKGEKVQEFSVSVKGGAIAALPRVPPGWRFKLVNEENGEATLSGTAESGMSGLKNDFFADFVAVDLRPNGTVRVKVHTTEDWVKTLRSLTFEGDKIVTRPAVQP